MEQSRGRPMAGRTVLVTGGSGGIGRATALGLAAMDAHLACQTSIVAARSSSTIRISLPRVWPFSISRCAAAASCQ